MTLHEIIDSLVRDGVPGLRLSGKVIEAGRLEEHIDASIGAGFECHCDPSDPEACIASTTYQVQRDPSPMLPQHIRDEAERRGGDDAEIGKAAPVVIHITLGELAVMSRDSIDMAIQFTNVALEQPVNLQNLTQAAFEERQEGVIENIDTFLDQTLGGDQ